MDNEEGGLDAWIGAIAAGLFTTFYYVALLPPWKAMYTSMLSKSTWIGVGFYDQLRWLLDWMPVIFMLIILFWAFISPVRREGVSWREI